MCRVCSGVLYWVVLVVGAARSVSSLNSQFIFDCFVFSGVFSLQLRHSITRALMLMALAAGQAALGDGYSSMRVCRRHSHSTTPCTPLHSTTQHRQAGRHLYNVWLVSCPVVPPSSCLLLYTGCRAQHNTAEQSSEQHQDNTLQH